MKLITRTSISMLLALLVTIPVWFDHGGNISLAEAAPIGSSAVIESIHAVGEGTATELVIKLSAAATYTSYVSHAPLRLIIDLSQATEGAGVAPVEINRGNFTKVSVHRFDSDAGMLSRITIGLEREADPVIFVAPNNPSELHVSFPIQSGMLSAAGTVIPADTVVSDVAPAASLQESITVSTPLVLSTESPLAPAVGKQQDTGAATVKQLKAVTVVGREIILRVPGGVTEFKSFRLNKPERFIVDLFGVQNGLDNRYVSVDSAGVASVRLGAYSDKLRVVLDAAGETLPEAVAKKIEDGVMITLEESPVAVAPASTVQVPVEPVVAKAPAVAPEPVVNTPAVVIPQAPVVTPEVIAPVVTPVVAEAPAVAAESVVNTPVVVIPAVPAVTPEVIAPVVTPEVVKPPVVVAEPTIKAQEVSVATPVVAQVQPASTKAVTGLTVPPSVEMVDFQVLEGISRVIVKVSGDVTVGPPVKSPGYLTLVLKNTVLPKRLQRSLEAKTFASPVLRVTPSIVKNKKGSETRIRIAMRSPAPYELVRESDIIRLDITNPPPPKLVVPVKSGIQDSALTRENVPATLPKKIRKERDIDTELSDNSSSDPGEIGSYRAYRGRKVTLEFADAEVRKIFQLLSEVSNRNFVLGDEVTGTISIKLVNVPWDQALDIILDAKGLDKRVEGNIIIVKGKGRFKSQAEEEQDIKRAKLRAIDLKTEIFNINYADIGTVSSQFAALKTDRGSISQDSRTNMVIAKDIPQVLNEMRKLLKQLDVPEKQVMIEARIVEATSTFTRSLGVNWGVHFRDGTASLLGINSLDTGFGGITSTAPPTSGVGSSSGGSLGISFGTLTSNIMLDLRLNAAASAGLVKIVSTPKVATLNNKTAKITQGQQIPYTSSTSDKVETKFVEAALSLEVTPHINANGTIGMKIDAKNDSPGSSASGEVPPINKKQATTEMLLRDGETTVIGGIFVDNDTDSDDGVPFLMDIPFLGRLFKSNTKTKTKTELLIFITPRILNNI